VREKSVELFRGRADAAHEVDVVVHGALAVGGGGRIGGKLDVVVDKLPERLEPPNF
jgi:hypothetical protein